MLALLAEEPRYGFDLVRELGAMDGMVTGEGTLYPLLSRLQKDGRLTSSWRDSDTGGPPRKYYGVTAKGRRALDDFVAEWGRFRDTVDHLLVKGTT